MISKVRIESDALQVCIAHALSTENEEVMGLLIGEIVDGITHVHAATMLHRLDKQKDRVEISPEQLSDASSEAEKLGMRTRIKRPMRIVGWYHSHPHITVWPSHVDVRTQAMYQMLDDGFIGLIVSCFNDDASGFGQIAVTTFQATQVSDAASYDRVDIAHEIIPCSCLCDAALTAMLKLPEILFAEECESYKQSLEYDDQDLLTAVLNSTLFTKSVMHIVEVICASLLKFLENELEPLEEELRCIVSHFDMSQVKCSR